MSTLKQDKAITLITSKKADNVGQAMRQAGYSNITSKTPTKLTKSKAWNKKLGALAKANNVTIEQYMMNIGLAMTAEKMNQFTGEITPDIQARLSGNKQAERFIGLDQPTHTNDIKGSMLDLAEDADEVQIYARMFKKNPPIQ